MPRRGLGHVGRRGYRYSNLGLTQRGRVIGAIAAHPNRMPGSLERLDDAELVFGEYTCEDRKFLRGYAGRRRTRRAHGARETNGAGHDLRGGRRVSREHHRADAHFL